MSITKALEDTSTLKMIFFLIRTAMLFAGVFCIFRSLAVFWEKRPVILKKRWVKKVDARVAEITEEHRSATMNIYYLVRFEYDEDGRKEIFAPPAYRPCRLKPDDEVVLMLGRKKNRFRTVRRKVRLSTGFILLAAGCLMIVLQLF